LCVCVRCRSRAKGQKRMAGVRSGGCQCLTGLAQLSVEETYQESREKREVRKEL
jgi:hypothetical protein